MAKRGNILYTDRDFTDLEVQQQFGFPVILILHDNNSVIKKISAFDENGAKSIYDFTLAASKDFVTATIATAISNIKDNTLEFPAFADFPQPGEVGNVYIDLEEDVLYIWDSASNSYISQSWNQSIITSIQTQITSLQNSKLNTPGLISHGQFGFWYSLYGNINNFVGGSLYQYGSNVAVGKNNPEEKFEVDGNVKANGFLIGTDKILPTKPIIVTGNITLDNTYNSAVLIITNTCTITIPTGLEANFNLVAMVEGSFIATFIQGSGTTVNAPQGFYLKTNAKCSLIKKSGENYILTGELATS